MTTYGYIRTSKGHDPDRPGMNPDTQRRDLVNAGVSECNIHSDIDVSGYAGVAARNAWRSLDSKLQRGDTLVLSALDRLGRRSIDVMWSIYDLVNRGVRLRSLAANEPWAKGLDADPESMEWMTAMLIAQVCAFAAQLERQSHSPPHQGRPRAGQGRGETPRPSSGAGRRPAHCHQAGRGGRDGRGGGGTEVRGGQVHAPQRLGPDGLSWIRMPYK